MLDSMFDRFGEIAVWLGLVEAEAVNDATVQQEDGGMRIGEMLEADGHLRSSQTDIILHAQGIARRHRENSVIPGAECTIDCVRVEDGIHVLSVVGDLTAGDPLRLPVVRDYGEVLVVSLKHITSINRGGVIALWCACGGQGVVFCEADCETRGYLEALGVGEVAPVVDTELAAMEAARLLVGTYEEEPINQLVQTAPVGCGEESAEQAELSITATAFNDVPVLAFSGPLLTDTNGISQRRLEAMVGDARWVVLDFTALTQATTGGLATVLQIGGDLHLCVCGDEAVLKKIRQLGILPEEQLHRLQSDAVAAATKGPEESYVGVRDSGVFHRPGCSIYKRSNEERRLAMTSEDLDERAPCKVCLLAMH